MKQLSLRSEAVASLHTQSTQARVTGRRPDDPATRERIPALDGLRGIAILLVLFLHFALFGGSKPTETVNRIVYAVLNAGWIGVDLFFVLSGFLITGILYRARGTQGYFRNFYMRRVLRIFPLYYCSLFVFLVVLPSLTPENPAWTTVRREAPWHLLYATNLKIALDGWSPTWMIDHFWSLAIEEQFYLFWPVVVLLCSRKAVIRWCACILIASLLLRLRLHQMGNAPAAYVLTPARFDSLAIGALIAVLAESPRGLGPLIPAARRIVPLSALTLITLFITHRGLAAEEVLIGTVGYSIIALFFGAVLIVAMTDAPDGLAGRIGSSRFLRFFGRYSYAMYVIHQPLLFLWPASWSIDAWRELVGSWVLAYLAFSITTLGAVTALSLASWHLLEKRFARLRFRFVSADARTTLHQDGIVLKNRESSPLPAP